MKYFFIIILGLVAFNLGKCVADSRLPLCDDAFDLKQNEVRACRIVGD